MLTHRPEEAPDDPDVTFVSGGVEAALDDWDLSGLDYLFIENVGNLVCPASYDLGEDFRLVLFSITEGEDISRALRFASAAAALKCTRFGGAFACPQRPEVEALLSGERVGSEAQAGKSA